MSTLEAISDVAVDVIAPEEITLTTGAREHVSKLLDERNMADHGLRVFVSGAFLKLPTQLQTTRSRRLLNGF